MKRDPSSLSIKDIARSANVSHSTVSRALRNSSLVNRETAEKIRNLHDHKTQKKQIYQTQND